MTLPEISQNAKDWLQALAWLAAAAGAVVATFKFWSELRHGRQQRINELRWKRAQAGKALNDEMLEDPFAGPAMLMLDYPGMLFELPSKTREPIERDDLRFALNPANEVRDEKHIYIRRCFDSLFYYMATLEHYTKATLVLPEDVAFPLDYYVPLLAKFRDVVDLYLEQYQLERVKTFLNRYRPWEDAAKIHKAPSDLTARAPDGV